MWFLSLEIGMTMLHACTILPYAPNGTAKAFIARKFGQICRLAQMAGSVASWPLAARVFAGRLV